MHAAQICKENIRLWTILVVPSDATVLSPPESGLDSVVKVAEAIRMGSYKLLMSKGNPIMHDVIMATLHRALFVHSHLRICFRARRCFGNVM